MFIAVQFKFLTIGGFKNQNWDDFFLFQVKCDLYVLKLASLEMIWFLQNLQKQKFKNILFSLETLLLVLIWEILE